MGTRTHCTLKAARCWRQLHKGWLAFGEASTCPIFYYLFILINSTLRPDWGSFVPKGQLLPWGWAERYQLSKWAGGGGGGGSHPIGRSSPISWPNTDSKHMFAATTVYTELKGALEGIELIFWNRKKGSPRSCGKLPAEWEPECRTPYSQEFFFFFSKTTRASKSVSLLSHWSFMPIACCSHTFSHILP